MTEHQELRLDRRRGVLVKTLEPEDGLRQRFRGAGRRRLSGLDDLGDREPGGGVAQGGRVEFLGEFGPPADGEVRGFGIGPAVLEFALGHAVLWGAPPGQGRRQGGRRSEAGSPGGLLLGDVGRERLGLVQARVHGLPRHPRSDQNVGADQPFAQGAESQRVFAVDAPLLQGEAIGPEPVQLRGGGVEGVGLPDRWPGAGQEVDALGTLNAIGAFRQHEGGLRGVAVLPDPLADPEFGFVEQLLGVDPPAAKLFGLAGQHPSQFAAEDRLPRFLIDPGFFVLRTGEDDDEAGDVFGLDGLADRLGEAARPALEQRKILRDVVEDQQLGGEGRVFQPVEEFGEGDLPGHVLGEIAPANRPAGEAEERLVARNHAGQGAVPDQHVLLADPGEAEEAGQIDGGVLGHVLGDLDRRSGLARDSEGGAESLLPLRRGGVVVQGEDGLEVFAHEVVAHLRHAAERGQDHDEQDDQAGGDERRQGAAVALDGLRRGDAAGLAALLPALLRHEIFVGCLRPGVLPALRHR